MASSRRLQNRVPIIFFGGGLLRSPFLLPGARLRLGANTSCSFFLSREKRHAIGFQLGKPGLMRTRGSRAFYKKKNLKRANKISDPLPRIASATPLHPARLHSRSVDISLFVVAVQVWIRRWREVTQVVASSTSVRCVALCTWQCLPLMQLELGHKWPGLCTMHTQRHSASDSDARAANDERRRRQNGDSVTHRLAAVRCL
jgi:hypothetical protein